MKMTFYGQFVAGEDHQSIRAVVQKNQVYGVGAVLDYSVEKISHRKTSSDCRYQARQKFGDRREGVTRTRTYFYADEAKCDQHVETFLKCIKASGNRTSIKTAIKMTALGRPQFLLQFSEVLVKWRCFFSFLAAKQGKDGVEVLEQKLDLEQLQVLLIVIFIVIVLGVSGTVDMLDWNRLINERTKISDLLVVPNLQTGQLEPPLSKFTEEEEGQMKGMIQRLGVLAKHAVEYGVRLIVDTEQTYFQPAILRLTVEMKRSFNRDKAVVFNTYQCYFKGAFDNVSMGIKVSRREGWCFGAKLVRGAYMYQERSRAAEIGYEDPINPDYESTNRKYQRCLDYMLEEIERNNKANVMVAMHNLDTVKQKVRMNEMGLAPTDKTVYFSQLLGMCNQISFPLGEHTPTYIHTHTYI
uniref:Proline dehydrogenase n=1 Tax=Cyprinus carpio TaxID=7962 RepID=A0A8C1MRF7_CYPCA